ncbi:NUDIX domain-containing protein [Caloramator sp. mosi_1]|uniref:NUDIX domain-containing protein n=1 Tax=Caloramator sp. mosi_1 TaxID=3023090 RepID=UPI00236311D0|nr:NUDIX domain-containing protein [Caloramator sp. mosi_1]WDC83517.1 NUDIX domain-containing protein [Caloramator sp. mosi_1]
MGVSGGKLEKDESPEECIVREIKEEINIDIEVIDIFDVVFYRYIDFNILMLVYKCKYKGGEIVAKEVEDYRWVDVSDLINYDF